MIVPIRSENSVILLDIDDISMVTALSQTQVSIFFKNKKDPVVVSIPGYTSLQFIETLNMKIAGEYQFRNGAGERLMK